MEYLPLVVEGIEHKIKKLVYTYSQLKEKHEQQSREKAALENEVQQLKARIDELESTINIMKVAGSLGNRDNNLALLQVNQLLREIHKCYSLLNR